MLRHLIFVQHIHNHVSSCCIGNTNLNLNWKFVLSLNKDFVNVLIAFSPTFFKNIICGCTHFNSSLLKYSQFRGNY